ncbi:hypothetical protein HMPREF9517_01699 [Enterococcus faecalis TX1341]|uniref:Uncharacterized protein n=1 Tax=Enterococcus faecalis ERV63 TaxID=1134793 RepID=A0AAV3GJ10_ENTFL|nr:hypothetical protein HMPREF9515_01924 [Enterococcus faecalis TX0860]EFT39548.1 hypothetical protein HMPREF9494_00570 [Enterococcus faecalis TX2137]EFU11688.1 hypothetical protein HMPREF9517_01699 [Enterococcus faecalis TX1341]EJU87027.1 hypothetical protein HMPREF1329_01898 [Enterococcus faecalis ERV116]EJU95643.1 hypothetical protein HMPREF1332_02870 [Enterococcus faecalis ERV31]EJU97616.1 hypothetical protein HMPREF1331_02042 [Enterococcus faecalis ERV25]EJV04544.1 hypothetical protein H
MQLAENGCALPQKPAKYWLAFFTFYTKNRYPINSFKTNNLPLSRSYK